MTESEWLACTDPNAMLDFLQGKATDRKFRLFAAACCRGIWGLLDLIGTGAVEVAERHADGAVSAEELSRAVNHSWWGADRLNYEEDHIWVAGWAAHAAVAGEDPFEAAALAAGAARREDEPASQCILLRDCFGPLPFRPVSVSPAWQTAEVAALAQAAYEERELPAGTLDLARLAVLADALEETGCDQADLLAHLRGTGPHVRGCWAVDLILGKE
jgi:hypothetical protein